MTPNQKAFLDMIAHSELGADLLAVSDNGYNVIVGSTPGRPILFRDYARHPNVLFKSLNSTAAGRYQILFKYADHYMKTLGLNDFSPTSQDSIAMQIIKEQRALGDIEDGNLYAAIAKCANIWASFPGAGYGQHENALSTLADSFSNAGGTLRTV